MGHTLYGIEFTYSFGEARPTLRSAEVLRETENRYIVAGTYGFLNYRSQIPKSEAKFMLTPLQAWETYRVKVGTMLNHLDHKRRDQVDCLAVAIEAIEDIRDAIGKIGGTD